MSKLKRNLVLANKNNNNNEMALLTLEKLSNGVVGTLKTYNIKETELTICLAENGKEILVKPVTLHNGSYEFNLSSAVNLGSNFRCVLAKEQNARYEPVVWDTSSEQNYKSHVCNILTENQTPKKETKKIIDLDKMYKLENADELEALIDQNLKNENAGLETKAQNSQSFFSSETDKIKDKLKEGEVFYDLVSDQIQDLFNKYPAEEKLEQLIPNSKWIKVNYSEDSNEYVLGLIYDDVNLKYICYGVPGSFDQNPPKDLENFSQWLPLNPDNVSEGGYWVMYQDALNGENIQIEYM